jgi:hypothetical protein
MREFECMLMKLNDFLLKLAGKTYFINKHILHVPWNRVEISRILFTILKRVQNEILT